MTRVGPHHPRLGTFRHLSLFDSLVTVVVEAGTGFSSELTGAHHPSQESLLSLPLLTVVAAAAPVPAGQKALGGDLLDFAVARCGPLRKAAVFQALQEAPAAAGFEHELLLFGQLLRGLEAAAGDLGFLRLDVQAEVTEGTEIAGGDGAPLTDLNFRADAGGFHFGALAVEAGERGNLLFVAGFFQFELDAAPVEGLFKGELKGLHRLPA